MKNIKVSISPRLWGEEFAASAEKDKYTGVIDRWTDNKKDDLMILWEGYSRCQRAPLSKMDVDALGESLNFQLEPDEHGVRPVLLEIEPPPPEQPPPAPTATIPSFAATDESSIYTTKCGLVMWSSQG